MGVGPLLPVFLAANDTRHGPEGTPLTQSLATTFQESALSGIGGENYVGVVRSLGLGLPAAHRPLLSGFALAVQQSGLGMSLFA